MKTQIYCDIADIKLVERFNKKKIVKGFTTNPSLMRRAGAKNYKNYSNQILNLCKKPISFEVFGDDYSSMRNQAFKINSLAKNIFVKIPVVNSKGVYMGKIIRELNSMGIKLNITAVYTAKQTQKILKTINKIFSNKDVDFETSNVIDDLDVSRRNCKKHNSKVDEI